MNGAPLGYVHDCVPLAVAALTELPVNQVAARLWPLRALWTGPDDVLSTGPEFGTPELAAADLLIRMGWGAERWDGAGRLEVCTEIMPLFLARLVHGRVVEVAYPSPGPRDLVTGATPTPPPPSWQPLRSWIDRLPMGRWMFIVHDTSSQQAHAVAVVFGKVFAGDSDPATAYADWMVRSALRIFPPNS